MLLVTLCFYSVPLCADAQFSIGIESGINKNYLITNNANQNFTNYKPLNSYTVGIPIQYKINSWFAVATDPTFIQKNYRQERSTFYTGVYQNNLNSYIQLPLMAHFMFGEGRLKGFFNGGIFGSYWVAGKVKGQLANILDPVDNPTESGSIFNYLNSSNYSEKYSFDKTKDNRFEVGWVAGAGVSYDITPALQVFSEARYLYSFTDQQKQYMKSQVPRYNSTYGINVGLLFSLPNKSSDNY